MSVESYCSITDDRSSCIKSVLIHDTRSLQLLAVNGTDDWLNKGEICSMPINSKVLAGVAYCSKYRCLLVNVARVSAPGSLKIYSDRRLLFDGDLCLNKEDFQFHPASEAEMKSEKRIGGRIKANALGYFAYIQRDSQLLLSHLEQFCKNLPAHDWKTMLAQNCRISVTGLKDFDVSTAKKLYLVTEDGTIQSYKLSLVQSRPIAKLAKSASPFNKQAILQSLVSVPELDLLVVTSFDPISEPLELKAKHNALGQLRLTCLSASSLKKRSSCAQQSLLGDNCLHIIKLGDQLILLLLSSLELQMFCFNQRRGIAPLKQVRQLNGGRFPRLDSMGRFVMVCDSVQPQVLRFDLKQ